MPQLDKDPALTIIFKNRVTGVTVPDEALCGGYDRVSENHTRPVYTCLSQMVWWDKPLTPLCATDDAYWPFNICQTIIIPLSLAAAKAVAYNFLSILL